MEARGKSVASVPLWAVASFAGIVALCIRLPGFSNLTLFRDDAWVALTVRVPSSQVPDMVATAPGFTWLWRTWISLDPGSTTFAQVPAFVIGLVGVFLVAYLIWRRCASHVGAVAVCLVLAWSPVAATYSLRLKPYGLDLVLAALMVLLATAAFKAKGLWLLALVSVVSVFMSGTTIAVVVGVWIVVVVSSIVNRAWRVTVGPAVIAGVVSVVLIATTYVIAGQGLRRFWHKNFFDFSSVNALVGSVLGIWRGLVTGLVAVPDHPGLVAVVGQIIAGLVVLVLLAASVKRHAPLASFGLAPLAVAVVAAAFKVAPLGTGRTDEALYPGLLLCCVLGAQHLGAWAHHAMHEKVARTCVVVACCFAVLGAVFHGVVRYPGTSLEALAATMSSSRDARVGSTVWDIAAENRYPWANSQLSPWHLVVSKWYLPGFTVATSELGYFIEPSESVEVGYNPRAWARVVTTGATKVVYFATTLRAPGASGPERAIEARGFTLVRVINGDGVFAAVYQRHG